MNMLEVCVCVYGSVKCLPCWRPRHQHVGGMCVWVYVCIGVWVYLCIGVWVYLCIGVWVYVCMGVQYRCMGV